MDEEFESFVVTNPDLVDEGIDVSGLKTTTDTSPYLLGGIPDYQGIQYSTLAPTKYTDLMRLYSSGLPTRSVSQPTTPPATGGGSGGGGQATVPGAINTLVTPPTTGGGITNVDTPLTQMITDPVTGQTQTVRQAMTSDPAYTGTTSDPFLASGAAGGARLPTDTSIMVEDLTQPGNVEDFQITGASPLTNQTGTIKERPVIGDFTNPTTVEGSLSRVKPPGSTQDFSVTGALGVDPLEKDDVLSGAITAKDASDPGFLAKIGLGQFNPAEAFVKAAINKAIGLPVTFLIDLLKDNLPPQDPRVGALNELYPDRTSAGTIDSGLMAGYNPVSGGFLNTITGGRLGEETTYGLQEAYQDRIDTIENTLADKYGMTAAEIADVKAGSYTGDVDSDLLDRLNQLEEAKEKEKGRLDLFSGDIDDRDQMLDDLAPTSLKSQVDAGIQAAEDDSGSDMLDTTTAPVTGIKGPPSQISGPQVTAPVTGVTRPGTVLGKPGIEKFDDAEAGFFSGPAYDKYSEARADAYANAPSKLEYDLAANKAAGQFLQDKAKETLGDNIVGKTVGTLGAVAGVPAAIFASPFHEAAQAKERVEDTFKGASPTIMAQGPTVRDYFSGFLDEQPLRTAISRGAGVLQSVPVVGDAITGIGEGVYDLINDPTIAEGTLADDTINRMTDDVDLDLFDTTPLDAPITPEEFDTADFGETTTGINPFEEMEDFTIGTLEDADNLYADAGTIMSDATVVDPANAIFGPGAQLLDYDEQVSPGTIRSGIENVDQPTTIRSPFEDAIFGPGAQLLDYDEQVSPGTIRSGIENVDQPETIFEPTPTPTVPDFISGGGRDRDPDPAPSAPVSTAGQAGPPSQRGGGADKSPSTGRGRTDAQSQYGGTPYGGPPSQSGGGGGGGGGGGCFLKGTQVTMADGSTKAIEQVDLGDKVAKGGKVFATGKFLVENLHDYKGIKVSGSHMVNEDGNWARVEDSKHGKALGDDEHTVYVFGAENRRILINDILFTDYFETTEQEKLINNEKDFFNNWKTYENKIDQDNINILNAS